MTNTNERTWNYIIHRGADSMLFFRITRFSVVGAPNYSLEYSKVSPSAGMELIECFGTLTSATNGMTEFAESREIKVETEIGTKIELIKIALEGALSMKQYYKTQLLAGSYSFPSRGSLVRMRLHLSTARGEVSGLELALKILEEL